MASPFDSRREETPGAVGREGILAMIDRMNERMEQKGFRERFRPTENEDGLLTFERHYLPIGASGRTRSPRFASGPRLAYSAEGTRD